MKRSLQFYTEVLDFERRGGTDDLGDPTFCVLGRGDDFLHLSSHHGDGKIGHVIAVTTTDLDGLFDAFRSRGLRTPGDPAEPEHVHEGPIDQTWGTREFYVDDPDGNQIRFIQEAK